MTDENDLKHLWRTQETESKLMSLANIHARARKLNSRRQWGNIAEYAACAVVVAAFGFYVWFFPGWMIKLGSALVILGTFFVAWQLHRRGPRRLSSNDVGTSIVAFHRAELVQVRDMLRSSWLWYIGPFVPGIVLITLGRIFQVHPPGRTIQTDYLIIALATMIVAMVFVLVAIFNLLRAHWIQKRIDELDAWQAEQ
jgi:hypothetical protein